MRHHGGHLLQPSYGFVAEHQEMSHRGAFVVLHGGAQSLARAEAYEEPVRGL